MPNPDPSPPSSSTRRPAPRFGQALGRRSTGAPQALPAPLRWGPLGIVLFWAVVMGALYLTMTAYLKPTPVTVSANGDLVIERARDGHFYALGAVNGRPVTFLVDTGASLVTVSAAFARSAELGSGEPTRFQTANGTMQGHIVPQVPVSVGPLTVSGVRVGVGLQGHADDNALLGQSFLSRFDIILSKDQMILRAR